MAKKLSNREKLEKCKSGKDFLNHAKKCPDAIIRNRGPHDSVIVPGKGRVDIPRHNKDLPKGTKMAIFKGFIRLGIAAFVIVTIYVNFLV